MTQENNGGKGKPVDNRKFGDKVKDFFGKLWDQKMTILAAVGAVGLALILGGVIGAPLWVVGLLIAGLGGHYVYMTYKMNADVFPVIKLATETE